MTMIHMSLGSMSRLETCECCSDPVIDPMAKDDSRTGSSVEAGSSSKDVQDEKDEGWLRLGLGGHVTGEPDPTARRPELVELDLLPAAGTCQSNNVNNSRGTTSYSTALFLQHTGASSLVLPPHHRPAFMTNWGFRPIDHQNVQVASSSFFSSSSLSSSFSSLLPSATSYFGRPLQFQAGADVERSSLDLRVVDPPRRPRSGMWFMLQASQNQSKEPFLPQLPKSYLRIRDGRMQVRLLIKYLANKLRLDSESEVEITCRGQQLLPFLTLQHVRDNIWSPRDAVTLPPGSSTTDHIMVIHYARSA
ncbi:hypothetical protein NMG60_11030982 [Bertholletia excelsa]